MKSHLIHGLVASLALAVFAANASATTCLGDISLMAAGGAVISASTDARGAVAVLIYDASGQVLQRLALSRGKVTALAAFPVLPGEHFDAAFVNKKGTVLCVDGIDIPQDPPPSGGGGSLRQ